MQVEHGPAERRTNVSYIEIYNLALNYLLFTNTSS